MKHLQLNGFSPVDALLNALFRDVLWTINTRVLIVADNRTWYEAIPVGKLHITGDAMKRLVNEEL